MIISELFEAPQLCPECGGISFSDLILAEKKDACYHKVKASAKVWPSAYASGRLVQCRKKGAANYGNKSESVAEGFLDEAVGMMIKGAAISGPDDQDIADRIAARTGGRVDSGSRGHHILITYPTPQDRAMAAAKIRKMFPGIEIYKSGGNRNAIDEQGMAEDWQKANKRDRTDGMSQKAVNAYRRENPGSKLKTAVTTKPSKLKKGGKASKRRKSYCSRSRGQMKMHSISCAKTPDKAICKARRRWNC
jgi:hypothetical protein